MFVRCNAVYDCPGREDEAACGSCPGFYRCYASNVCVHPSNVHPSLDLSAVKMPRLDTNSFSLFPNLHILNLSLCGVELMYGEGLQAASALQVLDLAGCPMTQFPRNLLSGLDRLQSVRADNFKLCCPANLPSGFNPANCKAPFDEVSSCEALLRSDVYRFFLSTFSASALLGNLGCFLLRSVCFKSGKSGFGVFVTHLSFSDFLMGVYLAIIGVADRLFQGTYLWEDIRCRESTACKVAGFLSLLSNEVSAFIICLITLDRFLVLRFPFKSLHFKNKSAHVTCGLVWVVVALLATVPLLPMTSHWSFYGQTGICIPLPITRNDYAGDNYAYGVMIIFNFILFLLIAAGQASICAAIRANRMSTSDSTKKSNDLRIARRLITVALSDFLCWFPIGLLGLLASQGIPIPDEVKVAWPSSCCGSTRRSTPFSTRSTSFWNGGGAHTTKN